MFRVKLKCGIHFYIGFYITEDNTTPIHEPWGKLFYKLVWHNIDCEGKSILDFGSGFGVTADYFAKNNEVTAIEPNEGLLKYKYSNNEYRQVIGGIEQLRKIPEQSFDMVSLQCIWQ